MSFLTSDQLKQYKEEGYVAPIEVLSTAHPCKFPDATNKAINKHEKLPNELQHVLDKEENFQVLKNNT